MRRALGPFVAILLLSGSAPAHAADLLHIVAAENFYGDVAAQIGGSRVEVTSIISNPDQDPHLFESSASTARAIADADIVIYNGADYDPWMDKLLSTAGKPDRQLINVADLTNTSAGSNPHLWYKPDTLPDVAITIARDLADRDKANAQAYSAAMQSFISDWGGIEKAIDEIRFHYVGTTVTATEPVFNYMADTLGLRVLNMAFQTAMMNDTEPSPSDVAGFENSLKDGSVKVLFYNSQVTDDTTGRLLALAKSNNIPVVGVTETMPAGQTVQAWFAAELAAVGSALSGQP